MKPKFRFTPVPKRNQSFVFAPSPNETKGEKMEALKSGREGNAGLTKGEWDCRIIMYKCVRGVRARVCEKDFDRRGAVWRAETCEGARGRRIGWEYEIKQGDEDKWLPRRGQGVEAACGDEVVRVVDVLCRGVCLDDGDCERADRRREYILCR